MNKPEWGNAKAALLFCGLIAKGLAMTEPLPFNGGIQIKAVAQILWVAFDGAFMWLLQPPKQEEKD